MSFGLIQRLVIKKFQPLFPEHNRVKMKTTIFSLTVILLIWGCAQARFPAQTKDESQVALEKTIEKSLINSPSFNNLKRQVKSWDFMIDDVSDKWITVSIGSMSEDGAFFHRWDTLRIQTNSGVILKLETDEKYEDKWVVDFQPPK